MRFDQPKDPDESIVVAFDFSTADVLSVTSPTVECSLRWYEGQADASPAGMVSGTANVDGAVVLQRLVGGLHLNDYNVRCTAQAPDGRVLVIGAVLRVRRKPV